MNTILASGISPSKVALTPLGVDLDLFRPAPRTCDNGLRVIFVGKVSQAKGLSYLVEAFTKVAVPHAELLLVGEIIGDASPWAGLAGIAYQRPLPRPELARLYHSADIYVQPSLTEGFGLTALEAMASGLPVIVSRNTFAGEIITDGVDGYVVPIRDSDAIAERLRCLAADPDLRQRMGRAARDTALQYPWSRYGDRIKQVMADLPVGSLR